MSVENKNVLFSRKASAWFRGIAIVMVILSHYAEWWTWFFVEEGTAELIREGVSRSGPYGVAIFLLFSGYGLVKSAGDKRIDWRFILKRILGVYIPYLVMVILIEMLSGGFETREEFLNIFYGQNFWYMTVLFSLYIAFMVIGIVFVNKHLRAVLITVFTIVYSHKLYMAGEYDFWYISNLAFAIGALLALYEPWIKPVMDKIRVLAVILFGVGTAGIIRSALFVEHMWELPAEEIRYRVIAVLIFTLFVVSVACMWNWCDPIFKLLGNYSLYFYLSHTFIFMWAVNNLTCEMHLRILLAAAMTMVASIVIGIVLTKILDVFYHKIENIVDFKHRKG